MYRFVCQRSMGPLPSRLEDAIRQQLKINYFDTLICVCGFVTYEVVSIQSIIDQFRRHRRKHAAYTPVLARGHVSARSLYPAAHSGLRRTNCRLSEDPYAVLLGDVLQLTSRVALADQDDHTGHKQS